MICNKVNVVVVLLTWMKLVISNGEYLSAAIPVWTKEVGQISKGNGAFISPNGKLLIVVAKDATVVKILGRRKKEVVPFGDTIGPGVTPGR